jgi:hypothetical protein
LTKFKPIRKRKPNLSSERMIHKDYDHRGSVAKRESLVVILKGFGPKAS